MRLDDWIPDRFEGSLSAGEAVVVAVGTIVGVVVVVGGAFAAGAWVWGAVSSVGPAAGAAPVDGTATAGTSTASASTPGQWTTTPPPGEAPRVSVSYQYDPAADELTIRHSGGDHADASRVVVDVTHRDGPEVTRVWASTGRFDRGDERVVTVAPGDVVRLRYRLDDEMTVISRYEVPDAGETASGA